MELVSKNGMIVRNYAGARYGYWLDYSLFHCSKAKIEPEAIGIVNEVVLSLLQKKENKLISLYETKKGQYRELDYYVLRMIKLNVYSPTSPYQYKNKPIPKSEVDFTRLEVLDNVYDEDEEDNAAEILKEMRLIRYVFKSLDLAELDRKVFEHYFILGLSFDQWPGPETYSRFFYRYKFTVGIIHEILFRQGLTKIKPQKNTTGPQTEIIERFFKTHKVYITGKQQLN